MTSLRLLEVFQAFLTTPNLDRVNAVLLKSLDLSDLASIDLNYGARHDLTPFVPEMSHTDLIADQAYSFAVSILRCGFLQLEVKVDLIFKRGERVSMISHSVHCRRGELIIIKDLGLLKVL